MSCLLHCLLAWLLGPYWRLVADGYEFHWENGWLVIDHGRHGWVAPPMTWSRSATRWHARSAN